MVFSWRSCQLNQLDLSWDMVVSAIECLFLSEQSVKDFRFDNFARRHGVHIKWLFLFANFLITLQFVGIWIKCILEHLFFGFARQRMRS